MFQIFTIPVTPFEQNARVLFDSESESAAIVDPGGDIDQIWDVVERLNPKSISIFLTHAHIDHAGGTAECLKLARKSISTVTPLFAHSDKVLRSTISRQAILYGLPAREYQDAPEPDTALQDGDSFSIGDVSAQVLWTPGHAPDHLSLYFEPRQAELHEAGKVYELEYPLLIAGDTLFAGSIGRTDLPGGDTRLLLRSIHDKLLVLPEETVVLPGHGPPTTIGQEKATNPFLQE